MAEAVADAESDPVASRLTVNLRVNEPVLNPVYFLPPYTTWAMAKAGFGQDFATSEAGIYRVQAVLDDVSANATNSVTNAADGTVDLELGVSSSNCQGSCTKYPYSDRFARRTLSCIYYGVPCGSETSALRTFSFVPLSVQSLIHADVHLSAEMEAQGWALSEGSADGSLRVTSFEFVKRTTVTSGLVGLVNLWRATACRAILQVSPASIPSSCARSISSPPRSPSVR